jgi:hypothetical protein
MEPLIHRVDQHTADGMECLLAAAALAVSSATSAASSGQMQICVRVSLCCNVNLCSFDATLCCFDWCLGVETAIQSDRSAKRPDGHWLCMLCPATIRSHQSNRPYQAGRAHNACILRANRANPPVIAPILRSKRPYDTLRSTQQRKRRDQLRTEVAAASERIGCPLESIQPASPTSPAQLLHLSTAERNRIRTVPSLPIPSEKSVIASKKLLANSQATATATFAKGAYITDPVRYVSVLCADSSFIAVGGDGGGGHTKLGVTYSTNGVQSFACLLVYEGIDHWSQLNQLTMPNLTPFNGDSSRFTNIFAVLQHFVNTQQAFLNGDWSFINSILGLMAPSATHPCPICIVSRHSFVRTARYRTPADRHSMHPQQPALLTILPERIVPTPLHLFLGISNRIIIDAFSELLGQENVESVLSTIKTVHSAGGGGRSDLYDLNGTEISKWIKHECSKSVLAAAAASSSVDAATSASHSILAFWLEQLHHCLLHSDSWTAADIDTWRSTVSDIQQNWRAETASDSFPKLHMLHHAVDFAERYRFLGRASESQIESFHARFNALFHRHHLNKATNISERLRRSLADAALRAVQPLVSP